MRYTNGLHCAARIFKYEGVNGLYRGAISSFVGMAFESSLLFGMYSQVKQTFQEKLQSSGPKPLVIIPLAATGGAIISFILCPLELVKVYLTLCYALVALAVGTYLHTLLNIGGLLTTLGFLGCISCILSTPPHDERKFRVLMGAATLEGATIGPAVDLAIKIDPSILVSAFVGCAIAFGCFSAAAIYAKRGEFMYLGGFLSSSISILFWLAIASSLFRGSTTIFLFQLYFSLLVFLGHIIYDTQSMVERAHLGDLDYVKHAMTLFSDFIYVFVRILIIMLKNSTEKEEKKRKKRT